MQRIAAEIAVSVSDLKKNPTAVVEGANGAPVAILNHNCVMAYMVPAEAFETMTERLDDQHLIGHARARAGEKPVKVSIDEL